MHYTPSFKSKKCKECDVFYNPLEVYEGNTPNNFEAGYRTQIVVDKKRKKIYLNVEELEHLLTDKELESLFKEGYSPMTEIDTRSGNKSVRRQTVKARTVKELVERIKKIERKL